MLCNENWHAAVVLLYTMAKRRYFLAERLEANFCFGLNHRILSKVDQHNVFIWFPYPSQKCERVPS